MIQSKPADPVLTEYVRDRLDRLMAESRPRVGAAEFEPAMHTVVRPRPALTAEAPALAVDETEVTSAGAESRVWPVQFTRQHLMVVAIILAIGALVAGYAVTRAKAVPVAAPVVVESAGAPTVEPPAGPTAATPTPAPVRVHVVGEVRQPGVHNLVQGARVVDAIEAAGGLTPAARPGDLNLAQVLTDGQQIVVGDPNRPSEVRGTDSADSPAGAAASGTGGGKVNLNTATAAQLDSLPGVGPVTAEKIIAWRGQHGRFSRIEELQEVPGIGPKSFAEIAPHVTV